MTETELLQRLADLETKDQVRDLLSLYCVLNDAHDRLDELADLFLDDAVVINAAGEHRGRTAIREYYAAFYARGVNFSRHYTLNAVVDILGPGRARYRSSFIALLGIGDESKIALGEYDDVLVHTTAGWRFERKGNHVLRVTDVEEGWALPSE